MSSSIEQNNPSATLRLNAVLPYDPETDTSYLNAIGSNEKEAFINLDAIGLTEDALARIVMVKVIVTPAID